MIRASAAIVYTTDTRIASKSPAAVWSERHGVVSARPKNGAIRKASIESAAAKSIAPRVILEHQPQSGRSRLRAGVAGLVHREENRRTARPGRDAPRWQSPRHRRPAARVSP